MATDSEASFSVGDKVRITAYANFTPLDRRIDDLIELRVKQTVGVVRHGSAYVVMVDFPEHTGLNVATAQLEAVPADSDGEATGCTTHSSPPATQTRLRKAYSAYREQAWNEHKTALDYVGWLERRVLDLTFSDANLARYVGSEPEDGETGR